MDSDTGNAFVKWFLTHMAVGVGATEAFAVEVHRDEGELSFPLLSHVRPGSSSPEIRKKAVDAFVGLITSGVKQGTDGVIELSGTTTTRMSNEKPQFCLYALVRDGTREPKAVVGFIARFADLKAAKLNLRKIQMVPDNQRCD